LTFYVELEAAARRISTYQPSVVDGLLQTSDYARALFVAEYPRLSVKVVERQVAIRLELQRQLLAREDPARLSVVLCESVLLRVLDGRETVDGLQPVNRHQRDPQPLGHALLTDALTQHLGSRHRTCSRRARPVAAVRPPSSGHLTSRAYLTREQTTRTLLPNQDT
jgi:hypothetical protein